VAVTLSRARQGDRAIADGDERGGLPAGRRGAGEKERAIMRAESLARAIGADDRLDVAADAVQAPVRRALDRSPLARTVLGGTWLGHSLHGALTDLPVGAWSAGVILDLLELTGDGERRGRGDAVHAIGLAGALGAAATGMADWSYTSGSARRIGLVHAIANGTVATVFGVSLLARARGHRRTGILLSTVGFAGLLFSSWLGGELAYGHGVGVSRTAFQDGGPEDWRAVLEEGGLPDGAMRRVDLEGVPVLVVRRGARVHAIGDTCTHMGCSLVEGTLRDDDVIVCPCHGSRFRLSDGQALAGPATASAPVFEARLRDRRVELRRARRSLPAPAGTAAAPLPGSAS
jgi:nitrite reductase/ring-hydroxylating ferredoxin subunit/uncharacterized membrane protein